MYNQNVIKVRVNTKSIYQFINGVTHITIEEIEIHKMIT